MSGKIDEYLKGIKSAAIAGHVNPDGDCVGSCCGLYSYITENYPEISVDLYLEDFKPVFGFLKGTADARSTYDGTAYERIFLLDVSSAERIGVSQDLLTAGKHSLCIDHHISNPGFAEENIIEADASSASEVLYTLLAPEKVSENTAAAIYTGIVHDSGVFQYSSTGKRTMDFAGVLMEKKIPFTEIIQNTYFSRTFAETRILGLALGRMQQFFEGKCVFSYVEQKEMEEYGVTKAGLDGIVAQMKLTQGVEIAVFVYPGPDPGKSTKVSLRSSNGANVSLLAQKFGGGGHVRAAGCTLQVPVREAAGILFPAVEEELRRTGFLA